MSWYKWDICDIKCTVKEWNFTFIIWVHFTRFDIFAKSPYWLHLSVRPHISAQLSLYRLFEILYCRLLQKSVEEIQICLKFDKKYRTFHMKTLVCTHFFCRMEVKNHQLWSELVSTFVTSCKAAVSYVMSVRLSATISGAPTGRIFVNIELGTLKKICRGIYVKTQVCLILSSATYVAQQYRIHFCTSITKL